MKVKYIVPIIILIIFTDLAEAKEDFSVIDGFEIQAKIKQNMPPGTAIAVVNEDTKGSIKKSIVNKNDFLLVHKDFKSKFETKISDIFKNYNLQGDFIIGIVDETGLVYSYALNRDILENKATTLNKDSPIYIASHTKAFTGTLLKILEDEGKLDLNKTLYDYLPELTLNGKIDTKFITVRDLLNHTHGINSGIVTFKTAYFGYSGSNKELLHDFNSNFDINKKGQFRYSNIGPILAGMIAERVTGNTWKEEMKKRIFLPLNMINTSSNVSDYNYADIRPQVTVSKDKIYESGFYKKDIIMHAAGGILSTINDLSKWLQSNINQDKKLLKTRDSWKALHKPTTTQDADWFTYKRYGYSLGWDISTYQKDTILTRFGNYGGTSFHLSFKPAKKIGIIAFSSDGRGFVLPHLAANYAYNLIHNVSDAEEIFNSEKEIFNRNFVKINKKNLSLPKVSDELEISDAHDKFIGVYKNKKGWPDISITKNNSNYQLKWGILIGRIHKVKGKKRPYTVSLNVLSRSLNIKRDNLFIGGLKYKKAY